MGDVAVTTDSDVFGEASKLPLPGSTLSRVETPTHYHHDTGTLKKEQRDMVRLSDEETVLGGGGTVTFEDLLACGMTMDELDELESSHGILQ